MAVMLDTETFKGGSATISFVSELAKERAMPFLIETASPALAEAKKFIAGIMEESKSSRLEGATPAEKFAALRESIAARGKAMKEVGEKTFGSGQSHEAVIAKAVEAAAAKYGTPSQAASVETVAAQFVPGPSKGTKQLS